MAKTKQTGSNGNVNNNDPTLPGLEDFMHCPVCSREFKEPKMLPCFHSFCEECLDSSLHQSEVSLFFLFIIGKRIRGL